MSQNNSVLHRIARRALADGLDKALFDRFMAGEIDAHFEMRKVLEWYQTKGVEQHMEMIETLFDEPDLFPKDQINAVRVKAISLGYGVISDSEAIAILSHAQGESPNIKVFSKILGGI